MFDFFLQHQMAEQCTDAIESLYFRTLCDQVSDISVVQMIQVRVDHIVTDQFKMSVDILVRVRNPRTFRKPRGLVP